MHRFASDSCTPEVTIMLSGELLALLGTSAALPYAIEALWSWLKTRRRH